jgi:hypothetical protein
MGTQGGNVLPRRFDSLRAHVLDETRADLNACAMLCLSTPGCVGFYWTFHLVEDTLCHTLSQLGSVAGETDTQQSVSFGLTSFLQSRA